MPDEEGKIWGTETCLGTVKKEKWVSPEWGEGQRAEQKASVSSTRMTEGKIDKKWGV